MYIPIWVLVLLIGTNALALLFVFILIYGIAIVHDLCFVKLRQPNKNELQCPFEKEINE